MNDGLGSIGLGPIAAFLSSVTWAIGSANYSKMTRDFRPFDVNFTRALFSLPLFLLAAFVTTGGWNEGITAFRSMTELQISWLTLSIFASYAMGDIFFFMSTVALGVPGALAIASGFPVLTAIVGAVVDQQMPSTAQWIGLVLSVSGMIIVILNDPKGVTKAGTEVKSHPWLKKKSVGVTLAVLCALSWGTNGYSIAKLGTGLNPAVANSYRMALALILIAITSQITTRTRVKPLSFPAIKRYGWVFVVESFLGAYLFVYGLSHSSILLGSTLSSLAPVLTVPIAVALKLEQFSWVRTAAIVTVVVGLSLLFR